RARFSRKRPLREPSLLKIQQARYRSDEKMAEILPEQSLTVPRCKLLILLAHEFSLRDPPKKYQVSNAIERRRSIRCNPAVSSQEIAATTSEITTIIRVNRPSWTRWSTVVLPTTAPNRETFGLLFNIINRGDRYVQQRLWTEHR